MKAKNTLDVGVFCITYRHHWLWSVITGTRPGVLLSQDASSATRASLGKRKRDPSVESDLPNHVSVNTFYQNPSATATLSSNISKTQTAGVMSFVLSLNLTIPKVGQKVLMGKGFPFEDAQLL
ncbi:hypothetical protein CBS63078_11333 [Aspergillus niger]|nr:hypothetical protein CBS63078_11333 [Aspergillus niger]